ncbi:11620_t:CDS:1, partial [Gigaspora rosea]
DCDKLVKSEFDSILGMSFDNLSLIEARAFIQTWLRTNLLYLQRLNDTGDMKKLTP